MTLTLTSNLLHSNFKHKDLLIFKNVFAITLIECAKTCCLEKQNAHLYMHFIFMNMHVFFMGKRRRRWHVKPLRWVHQILAYAWLHHVGPLYGWSSPPCFTSKTSTNGSIDIPILKLLILIHALLWNKPIHNIHI